MRKLDPRLERRLAERSASAETLDPGNPKDLVHVYVEVADDDFSGLEAAGYGPISPLAGSAIVILPLDKLPELAAREDVLGVHAPPVGQLRAVSFTIDQQAASLKEAYAVTSTTRPSGTHGADVAVGIVDSGFDVAHDAFRTTDATRKTRIAFYWAQDTTITSGSGPLWDRMGKVFKAADIDNFLTTDPSGLSLPTGLKDPLDHGTGVASVAAGSPWPFGARNQMTGVAPDAALIFVGGQKDDQAGIEFCLAMADTMTPKRPCVVNMSLGDNTMPHNGRSVFDKRINALLTAKAGRVLVVAAGNEGKSGGHARLAIPAHPGSVMLEMYVSDDVYENKLWISGTGAGGVKATLAPPPDQGSSTLQFFGHLGKHNFNGALRHSFSIDPGPGTTPGDTHWHISVIAHSEGASHVLAGVWTLKLETVSDKQPVIDVWPQLPGEAMFYPPAGTTPAKEEALEKIAMFRRPEDWILYTLRCQACGLDAIVVGCADVNRKNKSLVFPERSSSRGPNTSESTQFADWRPDVIAPGVNIKVATWKPPRTAAGKGTSSTRVKSGTSFASPMVAGTVALMLSHDPTLKYTDIRKNLRLAIDPLMNPAVVAWMIKYQLGDASMAGDGLVNIRRSQEQIAP